VREAIEKTIKDNELKLALGEPPRKPVYLVGQFGGEQVSIHGEKGHLMMSTGDGKTTEIVTTEMGMPKEDEDGRPGADSAASKQAPVSEQGPQAQEGGIQNASEDADTCEGIVGSGQRGRETTSPQNSDSDTRDVAGPSLEGRDIEAFGGASTESVAAIAASSNGYGRRPTEAAERQAEERNTRDVGSERGEYDSIKDENNEAGKTTATHGDSSGIAEADAGPENGRRPWNNDIEKKREEESLNNLFELGLTEENGKPWPEVSE
jgi:hypothetical protein